MLRAKKLIVSWLAVFLLLIFTGLSPLTAQSATSLSDVTNHWANNEINYLMVQGIVSGDPQGTFRPDDSIDRAEFITMINRAFKYSSNAPISFTDAKMGDWFYWEAAKAVKAGYISGFADGSIRPHNTVSRQEAAAIMARILELNPLPSGLLTFIDEAAIPAWSRGAIDVMVREGYMSIHNDGSFTPFAPISRAEAAVLIYDCMTPQVPVASVALDKSSGTLHEGETLTLTAILKPTDASNKKVAWSSSDETVATVSKSGQVTGAAAGLCTITVTTLDGRWTDTCRINVKPTIPVQGVSLDESSITIGVGYTFALYGNITPDDATNQNVAWSSSNESVALVNSSGQVTGIRPGLATVMVETQEGGFSDACKVNVTDEGYVLINPISLTMYLDRATTRNIYAKLRGDDSEILGVTWESDDEEVAVIDYDDRSLTAVITAVDTGTCTITIEVVTEEDEYQDTCPVRVLD